MSSSRTECLEPRYRISIIVAVASDILVAGDAAAVAVAAVVLKLAVVAAAVVFCVIVAAFWRRCGGNYAVGGVCPVPWKNDDGCFS